MQITIEELAMMLGQKDIEIFSLEKRLIEAQKRIEELTPKPQPDLKAVS